MDRTSKLLLAAIALGLWVNAGIFLLRPVGAIAQGSPPPVPRFTGVVEQLLDSIARDVQKIAVGTCANDKIC
jgi:hypothetical protein